MCSFSNEKVMGKNVRNPSIVAKGSSHKCYNLKGNKN